MNVILNTPIPITLVSATLIQESDGVGTLQFKILEQPVTLAFTSADYHYDTLFQVGDRVKLNHEFASFAVNSAGILQKIVINPTFDQADVFFDEIYPDMVTGPINVVGVTNTAPAILARVPLSYLEIV